MTMNIVPMTGDHCSAVAQLHVEAIRTGLTAFLGRHFCEQLYLAMGDTPYSFVLVAVTPEGDVGGFICGATNVRCMYRHVLLHRWHHLLPPALVKLLNPAVAFRALRAVMLPWMVRRKSSLQVDLPEPALVSMAVSSRVQGGGVGSMLVEALFEHLRALGASACRVWTSEDNARAKAFYEKRGFVHVGDVEHHSGLIRFLVAPLDRESSEPNDSKLIRKTTG